MAGVNDKKVRTTDMLAYKEVLTLPMVFPKGLESTDS